MGIWNKVNFSFILAQKILSSDGATVWGVETKILSFLIKHNAVLDFFFFFLNVEKWEIQDPKGYWPYFEE